jgi:hypothetical protein
MVAVTETDVWRVAPESHVPASGERLRVLVVDDHPAVRRGLFELLSDQPDFRVIAVASSAEDAMSVAEREAVDVAVVDYQLDGRDGLWLSRKLGRLPRPPRVIIYSAYSDGWPPPRRSPGSMGSSTRAASDRSCVTPCAALPRVGCCCHRSHSRSPN